MFLTLAFLAAETHGTLPRFTFHSSLNNNNLNGPIPSSLGSLSGMHNLYACGRIAPSDFALKKPQIVL